MKSSIKNLWSGTTARFVTGCVIILSSALAAYAASTISESAKNKPNFVFILVDDLGWRDLGCFGSTFYETPNIDRLAGEGIRFTNAYSAGSLCSPTRASIMSGKYPARINLTFPTGNVPPQKWKENTPLLPAPSEEMMLPEEVTFAEALRESGYGTFFAGKWHLGYSEEFWPEAQGFDINRGGWTRGGPSHGKYFSPYFNPKLLDGPEGEHLPDRLARETVEYIKANRDRPFLAYLSFYSVHHPIISRKDLEAKYEEKAKSVIYEGPMFLPLGYVKDRQVQSHPAYAGMIEAVDQAVGKVLDAIVASKLEDNTIVIFMSDNGGESTEGMFPTSNKPLKAGKAWLYEGGIRVPMIIKWPGVSSPGTVCSQPVISTDFYPTILEMAGLPLRPRQHIDGVSLVPLCKGRVIKRRALYWHYPHYSHHGNTPTSAARMGDWKLIHFYEDNHCELYNLSEDIGGNNNLVELMPDKARELQNLLDTWLKEVDARMSTPNPAFKPEMPHYLN